MSWCWRKARNFWPWYKSLYKGRKWYTKTLIAFVSCIVAFLLYLGAVDINFLWLFGKSPGYFSGIMDPQTSQASEIYAADGTLIGKFFNENRSPVKYEEINPYFFKALIDTEDERYYKRPRGMAVDPIGIFSAMKDAVLRHDGRGASTISQQLAKNMFRVRSQYSTGLLGKIPGLKILIVKSKEWIIATKLETVYNKKEILTMYANTVDFGSNAYGIKTAAKTYFDTTPKDLTTEQCALLVGMLKATTMYNPRTNPKNSLARRNTVLHNLYTHRDLSREECDSLQQIPIQLHFKVEENYDGQAMYFREAIANELQDWCKENGYDLYSSGLKIYTTLDPKMQKYAEEAVLKQMKIVQRNFDSEWGGDKKGVCWYDENGNEVPHFIEDIAQRLPQYKQLLAKYANNPDSVSYYMNKPHMVKLFDYDKGTVEKEMSSLDSIRYMVHFMHCAMVAMEPETGAVRAYVGDVDFKTWKFDKAEATHQPGSTFKLFVYTEAMNQGLTPCDKRRDEYISMQVYDKKKHEMTTWTPTNANGTFSGDSLTLRSAFARSINSVAVRVGQEVGIKRIIETAQAMGIKSPLDDEPSLALGSSDVKLPELLNAYCVVADNGRHHDPVMVIRIVDKDGNEVYTDNSQATQVIPVKSAYLMQQMLMAGTHDPGGTSTSLSSSDYAGSFFRDTDFGGKTGTSNSHADAWFMAVSPKLCVGAWVGGEYRSIHFKSGRLGQGSRSALPICGYFIKSVFSDPAYKKYHGHFAKPDDESITSSMYNCVTYIAPVKHDTVRHDSAHFVSNEEVILDEDGNPVEEPQNQAQSSTSSSSATTGSKTGTKTDDSKNTKKHKKTTEEVNFNNL